MRERERGSALFIAMLVVLVVASLSVVVVSDSVAKAKDAELEVEAVRALFVAESAIDLAMNSVQTGGNGRMGTGAWGAGNDVGADGNGATVDAGQGDGLPTVGEPNVVLQDFTAVSGGQYYTFAMFWGTNGIDDDGDGVLDALDLEEKYIWTIWAWGRFGNTIRRIKVIAEYHVVSIWDNAIIAGSGASGASLNGNVGVHGGMLIFAEDSAGVPTVASTDNAFLFSGTGGVQDNYNGLTAANIAKMPPLPPGKDGLQTFVRLKHGKAGLSGSGTLGDPALGAPDDPATIANDQEMVDGVFITDGYGGNQGDKNVYSENGPYNPWDLPDSIKFPRLTDPYYDPVSGITFANYDAYTSSRALVVPAATIQGFSGGAFKLDNDTNSFTVGPDLFGNKLEWDKASATLKITGVVRLDQSAASGDFSFGKKGNTLKYDGRGTIYIGGTTGNMHVHGNVVPLGQYLTDDVMGFVTKRDMFLADGPGDSQLSMFGIWRAGNKVTSQKQNEIYGSFIAEFFDMGTNVPHIAHHPEVTKNMPPGFNSDPVPTTLFIDMWGEW
ncbi:MAG: hypothetical protein HYY18_05725 [Planctomycetes bacterium]|nr:hypothetical protein [Planctomycetota bacterium]